MQLYNDNQLCIMFGARDHAFIPHDFYDETASGIIHKKPFMLVPALRSFKTLNFLQQVHGVHGTFISKEDAMPIFRHVGDYLITTDNAVGVAIATADCLPVILYHANPSILAIVHAGWRGALAGIIEKVIRHMQHIVPLDVTALSVYLGPSAGVCCYQVQSEIVASIPADMRTVVLDNRDNRLFFDLPLFITLTLSALGVKRIHINQDYYACTICNTQFCSYRRDKTAWRQVTIAGLLPSLS